MTSSAACSSCHLDWRPSRQLAALLCGLGLMAAIALGSSRLPPLIALPAALLALAEGARLAGRHLARPPLALDWRGGDEPAFLTGRDGVMRLEKVRLAWRGPLAVLSGRDGRGHRRHLAWWPDTLPASGRRQLRLAAVLSRRSAKPLPEQAA